MGWLEDRANNARGLLEQTTDNVPNVTNSPDWLTKRAEGARALQINVPKPVTTTVDTPQPTRNAGVLQTIQNLIGNLIKGKQEPVVSEEPKVKGDIAEPKQQGKAVSLISDIVGAYKNYTQGQLKKVLEDKIIKLTTEVKKEDKNANKIDQLKKDIEEVNVAMIQPSLGKKYLVSSKQKFMRTFGDIEAGASTLISMTADFYNKVYEQDAETMSKMATVNKDSKVLNWWFKQEQEKSTGKSNISKDVSKNVRKWAEEVSPANPDFMDALASGVGSMGAFMVASVASGSAAISMSVLEAMGESGTVYRENRDKGISIAESSEKSDKDFLANLVINYFTNKLGIFSDKQTGIRKTIMAGSNEGVQEALQQIASNITTNKDIMVGVPESLGIGALLGTAVSPLELGGTVEKSSAIEEQKPIKEKLETTTPVAEGGTTNIRTEAERNLATTNTKLAEALQKYDNAPVPTDFTRTYQVIEKGQETNQVFSSEQMLRQFIGHNDISTSSINIRDIPTNQLEPTSTKGILLIKEAPTVGFTKQIAQAEQEIKDIYIKNRETVEQAFSEVWTEMDIAEAGQIVTFEQPDTSERGVMGIKSTFPSWVPEDLRSKVLFDKVLSGITDIKNIKYPPANRTAQRALYDAILKEVDQKSGLDTSTQRGVILESYEKAKTQQPKTKIGPKKSVSESTTGRKESTESEVASAREPSQPRDNSTIAKTPEQLKQIIDGLNKYGQSYAILRRTGGLTARKAVGQFVPPGKSKTRLGVAKEGQVRLKGSYIADDKNYISTLAHELGHATEYSLTGVVNKKTLDVFGDNLTTEQRDTILSELKDVTESLEGAMTVASNPSYYNMKTELLARFFEMYITNPELLQSTAPTAYKALEEQSVKHPMIREFLEVIDENMAKKDTPKFSFLPDLRETYQKALGSKRVGNIAFHEEIVHRSLVERAKKILPEFIESKFKGVKDNPELLFRTAEAVKVTKDGVPEFGTRDFNTARTVKEAEELEKAGYQYTHKEIRDGVEVMNYAKYRYTSQEAESLYNQLSAEGKQLIKDFTAQRSEATDYFNREVIKDINKINSNLEGWVHHYFEEGKGTTVGKSLRFRKKKAGATMRRTGEEGYVMDLKKATTKAIVELETAKVFNDFIDKQFARVSKPIPEGHNPDKGWVEVMGNLRKGVGLEGDVRTTVITNGKAVKAKQTRYQVPTAVYERYKLYRGLIEEASGVAKAVQRLNSYWAINILTDVGTAGTNFIGGGIQYSAKVLNDFYSETLFGELKYEQTRRDITAMLKVLLPKGWHSAPDWVYGADLSNWYGQFSQKQISKADKALDAFADKNLKLFGSIERYWKKVIMTGENVKDVKSLEQMTTEGLRLPTEEERKMIAKINSEVDLFAYDYDNIPLWLTKMKRNPIGVGIKPFATYPYKYAKQITGMVGSAFDQSLPWQDRVSRILALSTLMAIYAMYSDNRKKKQQTPEGTNPEIEIRTKSAGNLFTGLRDAEGNELFVRVSKYPFFGLTEAGIQTMKGNTDSASNIFKEMVGSIGFVGKTGLNVLGYRDEYEKYDPYEVVLGNNLSGLVPYTRLLDEISRGLDPFKRKQKTFGQTFTRLIPTTNVDLQEKLHGEARTTTIPIEGSVKRTPGTPYTRTTIDRALKNYWQDILLSSLTGIYIKRVNPADVEAQLIRDKENKEKNAKKTLKGSK